MSNDRITQLSEQAARRLVLIEDAGLNPADFATWIYEDMEAS